MPDFADSGAFNINDQWATAIRYDATLENDRLVHVSVKFLNGRAVIAEMKGLDRDQAVHLLGEKNISNIEAGLGRREAAANTSTRTGRLQGQDLIFHKSYTPAQAPENSIALDTEPDRDRHFDARVRQWIQHRRRQLVNLQQALVQGAETPAAETLSAAPAPSKPPRGEREDRSQAIPASVSRRFLQVNRQFYFPDRSPAFEDQGRKLTTASEHQEVVRALIAIAQARDWAHITVSGTETFRRAAWLEAAQKGIEVRGYQPSELDKAHLVALGRRPARQSDPQERVSTSDPASARALAQETNPPPNHRDKRSRSVTGILREHGPAPYQQDEKNDKSYFIKLETPKGEQTLWGVDLERALRESGAQPGDQISVKNQGRQAVTVRVKERDPSGQVVGISERVTHRNAWQVEKAQAFRTQDRAAVVQAHPDLAPAYGALAAAHRLAEKHFKSPDDQVRFVAVTKETLARRIESNQPIPAPRIRQPVQEQARPSPDLVRNERDRKEREQER
ncbi:MAG TPA: LPD7 domain-containing protein [Candidatus Competibacteraceae bacterium]|nr:LPD7 domain-containing protein [Candidatus Competibacteraceae bacterium]